MAAPAADPVDTIRRYIDAFNKADANAMAACFAVPGSILDGMAPHVWRGPTATEDWYRDVLVEGARHEASDYFVTLGTPLHATVTGDNAYVVFPATMTFKVHGKQGDAIGSDFYHGPLPCCRWLAYRCLGVGQGPTLHVNVGHAKAWDCRGGSS